jgi:hypothetical protein
LPVVARDILEVGPLGLGVLRGAPAVGGMSMALYLSAFPIRDRAGIAMLSTVALFGLSSIVFGLSSSLWLSAAALVVLGASDTASVYIRWTLVQLWTPDEVRGRVSAVSGVSASGSTELGEFRAGVFAALIGTVPALLLGGFTTLLVVLLWARWFPELVRIRHLDRPI